LTSGIENIGNISNPPELALLTTGVGGQLSFSTVKTLSTPMKYAVRIIAPRFIGSWIL